MADPTNPNPSPNVSLDTSGTPPTSAPSVPMSTDIAMTDADSQSNILEPASETPINRGDGDTSSSAFPSTRNINIRQYLNEKVCPSLTAGCKLLVQDPEHLPEDPLRILGEFFLERHAELVATQKGKELHNTTKGNDKPNGDVISS
ncbi:hypothetical protein jhhlp_002239 [Lomentospora prolificans]|uniref:Uncharacterized protein n=1 Tax=Lomentospora prolificans TaxID=41688 RepID=A0A2N3NDL2_9PEZI|nr:hypothetical protein jhhlp_002239 [Lomentospora prolificans]